MDINFMRFGETLAKFDETSKNTILDYAVTVHTLDQEDRIILYQGQNYSVTGTVLYCTVLYCTVLHCTVLQVWRCGCTGTC